jgi:hypothetical protein
MENVYLYYLNKRLVVLNQNRIEENRKELYIKSLSDYIYSLCYNKNIKINYDILVNFIGHMIHGIQIGDTRYGGLQKIYFYDSMTRMTELIKDFMSHSWAAGGGGNRAEDTEYIIFAPNNNTGDASMNVAPEPEAHPNSPLVVSYNNNVIFEKQAPNAGNTEKRKMGASTFGEKKPENEAGSLWSESTQINTVNTVGVRKTQDFLQKNNLGSPSSSYSNSFINAVIYGYQLNKYFRNIDSAVQPRYVSSVSELMKITRTMDTLLFIFDDYSNSGQNLLDRVLKIKKIVSEKTRVYFFYSHVNTDTIFTLIENKSQVPERFQIVFGSLVYNFPVCRYNFIHQNNSRFFCINKYYTTIFNFLHKNEHKFIFYKTETNVSTMTWYLFCKQYSEIMDNAPLEGQRYLSSFYKQGRRFLQYEMFEFYMPTTHVFSDYNMINTAFEKNIFLTGKIHKTLSIEYIIN